MCRRMAGGKRTMGSDWTRRRFLGGAAISAASIAAGAKGMIAETPRRDPSGLQGRFLTHVSLVRVNQIEVTPISETPRRDPSGLQGRFLTHVSLVRVNQIEVTP